MKKPIRFLLTAVLSCATICLLVSCASLSFETAILPARECVAVEIEKKDVFSGKFTNRCDHEVLVSWTSRQKKEVSFEDGGQHSSTIWVTESGRLSPGDIETFHGPGSHASTCNAQSPARCSTVGPVRTLDWCVEWADQKRQKLTGEKGRTCDTLKID